MKRLLVIFLSAMAVLSGSLVWAKDANNLDQYDDQVVADILQILDNLNYPLAKQEWGGWIKIDQYGQKVTSDQRLISLYYMLLADYQTYEAKFAGLVNDSSCGEESIAKQSAFQTSLFGGLPGYAYFVTSSSKVKIERAALQADGTSKIKNIACARNVAELSGVTAGQEEYVKAVLSSYFPDFVWGNLVWNPDDKALFAVEVLNLPAKYLTAGQ